MAKPRKPTKNAKAFQREVERLEKLVKVAKKKGIIFLETPIPEKPERVTQKQLHLVQDTTLEDILLKGYTVEEETGELKPVERSQTFGNKRQRLSTKTSYRKPRFSVPRSGRKEKPSLTPEERHQIRSLAARKAQETIKRRMAEDPEYRERILETRRRSAERMREGARRRNEELKRRMAEDPVFAQQIREERSRRAKEASRKARETMERRMEEDPEYAIRIKENRERALEKARATKAGKTKDQSGIDDFGADYVNEEYPDIDNLPEDYDSFFAEIHEIISTGNAGAVCDYLNELLLQEEQADLEELYYRLKFSKELIKSRISDFEEASTSERLVEIAQPLIYLITGKPVTDSQRNYLQICAESDRPPFSRTEMKKYRKAKGYIV